MSAAQAFRYTTLGAAPVADIEVLRPAKVETRPDWFVFWGLCDLPEQEDEKRLIEMAERLWPSLDWLPADVRDRNRGAWYKAVVRQRSTGIGWVMDRGTKAPKWGNVYPIARAA